MGKVIISALLLLTSISPARGQDHTSDILHSIATFFQGFVEQDTTKMWNVTDRGARLVITTYSEDGDPVTRPIEMSQFMNFIARPKEEKVEETYWDPQVYVHDNLATVWLDYNLWVGDYIDHCGKDSFQLARDSTGWKIIAIADTQRKEGCISRK